MKYLITIWEGEKEDITQFEVSEQEGVLFGHLVDLEVDISDGTIKAFKVEVVE